MDAESKKDDEGDTKMEEDDEDEDDSPDKKGPGGLKSTKKSAGKKLEIDDSKKGKKRKADADAEKGPKQKKKKEEPKPKAPKPKGIHSPRRLILPLNVFSFHGAVERFLLDLKLSTRGRLLPSTRSSQREYLHPPKCHPELSDCRSQPKSISQPFIIPQRPQPWTASAALRPRRNQWKRQGIMARRH